MEGRFRDSYSTPCYYLWWLSCLDQAIDAEFDQSAPTPHLLLLPSPTPQKKNGKIP